MFIETLITNDTKFGVFAKVLNGIGIARDGCFFLASEKYKKLAFTMKRVRLTLYFLSHESTRLRRAILNAAHPPQGM
jgi:hypothetical protein